MERLPSVVADIMSHPVITVDVGVNIRDATLLMTNKEIGCLIIVERGRPMGIVTKSDIIRRVVSLCKDPCVVKVEDVMSKPLITIGRNINILEAMRKMREHSITQMVVMDDENLVGIVAERDVIRGVSIASIGSFSSLMRRRD
jgi:CBS domain-containing protein